MTIEPALASLYAGNPTHLRLVLETLPAEEEYTWIRVWSAACVLYGTIAGRMRVCQGDRTWPDTLWHRALTVTGGPPRVVELEGIVGPLSTLLSEPPTLLSHLVNIRCTLQQLELSPDRGPEHTDPQVALLRHHTDEPVDLLAGRHPVVSEGDLARELVLLRPLAKVFSSGSRFRTHLEAGISSPSEPRRQLSEHLLSLG